MNYSHLRSQGERAAALIELMISTTIVVLTGGIIFYILNTGMVLFAKNTAINMAHQQARVAVLQMEHDLHSAISIPQLTDANQSPISGSGPAAGITFQQFAAGPFKVTPTATQYAAGQKNVTIRVNGYKPVVGQRLIIPTHQIEMDITAVGTGSTDRVLTLTGNLPVPVLTTLVSSAGASVAVNVSCFITDRYNYVVSNGELRYFKPGGEAGGRVMANDITSPAPFSIPVTPKGAQYNRFVAAINLSTADDRSSNRGFKAANMFLNALEPYRARMCITQ